MPSDALSVATTFNRDEADAAVLCVQDAAAHDREMEDDTKDGDEGARARSRLVWTPELHERFMNAVNHLGVKHAVPKTILQLMNVEGLTRENVASHLQVAIRSSAICNAVPPVSALCTRARSLLPSHHPRMYCSCSCAFRLGACEVHAFLHSPDASQVA